MALSAQKYDPSKAKAPLEATVEGAPSSSDPYFKGNFTVALGRQEPLEVKGTSSRALGALKQGPKKEQGHTQVKLSDHHSICISARGVEVAVGSADSAVYIVNVETGKFVRTMGSKEFGHTEWVTCLEYMENGRIFSGGMDSKLCLWEKNVPRCSYMVGHNSAISGCQAMAANDVGVSSSYDGTLKVWDLSKTFNEYKRGVPCLGTLKGHHGPVTKFVLGVQESSIVSGSKTGEIILWDGAEGRPLMHCVDAHNGAVTAIVSMVGGNKADRESAGTGEMFLTGGQDGMLQVWDFRVSQGPVFSVKAHRTFQGCPVAFVGVSVTAGKAHVVTAGGDKVLKVLDPRASFQTVHTMPDHTSNITALQVYGVLLWSGAADGKVLLHEVTSGNCLYCLPPVAKGSVRCLTLAGDSKLAVAGDDGTVVIYPH